MFISIQGASNSSLLWTTATYQCVCSDRTATWNWFRSAIGISSIFHGSYHVRLQMPTRTNPIRLEARGSTFTLVVINVNRGEVCLETLTLSYTLIAWKNACTRQRASSRPLRRFCADLEIYIFLSAVGLNPLENNAMASESCTGNGFAKTVANLKKPAGSWNEMSLSTWCRPLLSENCSFQYCIGNVSVCSTKQHECMLQPAPGELKPRRFHWIINTPNWNPEACLQKNETKLNDCRFCEFGQDRGEKERGRRRGIRKGRERERAREREKDKKMDRHREKERKGSLENEREIKKDRKGRKVEGGSRDEEKEQNRQQGRRPGDGEGKRKEYDNERGRGRRRGRSRRKGRNSSKKQNAGDRRTAVSRQEAGGRRHGTREGVSAQSTCGSSLVTWFAKEPKKGCRRGVQVPCAPRLHDESKPIQAKANPNTNYENNKIKHWFVRNSTYFAWWARASKPNANPSRVYEGYRKQERYVIWTASLPQGPK